MSNVTETQSYLYGVVNKLQLYILDAVAEEVKYGNQIICVNTS